MFAVGNPLECDGSDDAGKSKTSSNCFQGLRRINNLQVKKEGKKEVKKEVKKEEKKEEKKEMVQETPVMMAILLIVVVQQYH